MFSGLTRDEAFYWGDKNMTFNAHVYGVTPNKFYSIDNLKNNYRIIAISKDYKDREFIAAFEHIS